MKQQAQAVIPETALNDDLGGDWEIEIRPTGGTPIILRPRKPKPPAMSDDLCKTYAELIRQQQLAVAEATARGDAKAAAAAEYMLDLAVRVWRSGECDRLGDPNYPR